MDFTVFYRRVLTKIVGFIKFTHLENFFWIIFSQNKEYFGHKKDKWRKTSQFIKDNNKLFKYWGFCSDDYINKTIIDVGAGSKLRTKFFKQAKIIAIEPLANRFIKNITWCDLTDSEKVYSTPAEFYISDLKEKGDLIFCINVLDHVKDYKQVLESTIPYLNEQGIYVLSVDLHEAKTIEHPISINEEELEKLFECLGVNIFKKVKMLPDHPFFGQGEAVTYFLKRKDYLLSSF